MSEVIDKLKQPKAFQSKSVDHVVSYPLIKQSKDYALSFGLVNYIYQQVFSVVNYVNIRLCSYDVVYNNLKKADGLFDALVLSRVDLVLSYLPTIDSVNPLVYLDRARNYVSVSLLKPANNILYSRGDKYLPATVTENKAVFKLELLNESSEVTKFFKILNEFVSRTQALVSEKSNEVSNNLVSTYNSELHEINDKTNAYRQRAVAAYNTIVKYVHNVNSEYVQPLRAQTQEYVVDVAATTRSRADNIISEAKSSINGKAEEIRSEGAELLNGSSSKQAPAVSASA